MNPVDISLTASSREDLAAAIARIQAAGLDVRTSNGSPLRSTLGARHCLNGDWLVHGTLAVYDTLETADAKARAAGAVVRQFIDRFEYP